MDDDEETTNIDDINNGTMDGDNQAMSMINMRGQVKASQGSAGAVVIQSSLEANEEEKKAEESSEEERDGVHNTGGSEKTAPVIDAGQKKRLDVG